MQGIVGGLVGVFCRYLVGVLSARLVGVLSVVLSASLVGDLSVWTRLDEGFVVDKACRTAAKHLVGPCWCLVLLVLSCRCLVGGLVGSLVADKAFLEMGKAARTRQK